MLVARLVQKRISTVHQIAWHVLVRILNRRQSGLRLNRVHADDEEDLLVALHQAVELVHQISAAVVLFALARGALFLRFILVNVQTVFARHFSFFLSLFFEHSAIRSSIAVGQKSPSKYGICVAQTTPSSFACE